MSGKKGALVIDVQFGFLTGGGLSVTGQAGEPPMQALDTAFTKQIDDFLRSGGFDVVYFSKDMHHPTNASIGAKAGIAELEDGRPAAGTLQVGYYTGKNTSPNSYTPADLFPVPQHLTRTWASDLDTQFMWPIHCILPKSDPWHSILVGNKANGSEYPASLYNSTTAEGKGSKNGSDLAWALEKYDDGLEAPFDYYTVYKGFGKKIDSYSAVADAHGYTTPFIAKHKGAFLNTKSPVTYFIDELKRQVNEGLTDLYVMGIATNYCVEQTVKDILDLVVLPAKAVGKTLKIHFVHNLTLPVPGPYHPAFSKADIETRVAEKFGTSLSPLDTYFVVEDAPIESAAAAGGARRCRCGKTRKHKGHCKQTRRSRCNCGKTRKHKKQRKCL